jgi:hypothetical protein
VLSFEHGSAHLESQRIYHQWCSGFVRKDKQQHKGTISLLGIITGPHVIDLLAYKIGHKGVKIRWIVP